MDWATLSPALIAGLVALLVSLVTAIFLRRSSKETNQANSFKLITDQLFQLNKELREEVDELREELKEVQTKLTTQQLELEQARVGWAAARKVNAGLAAYIKKLLSLWPVGTTPPNPDETLDWEAHL